MKFIVLLISLFLSTYSNSQETDDQYVTAYVVIADTSSSYEKMRCKMESLAEICKIEIDTMERTFNASSGMIEYPMDVAYGGEYYGRRYTGTFLSLEHLGYYLEDYDLTIALLAGLYDNKRKAEARRKKISKVFNQAQVIETKLFMGCLH